MNIFVLHTNPRKAARYHVDKHVRKMILETCQLLYTVHWALWYPECTRSFRGVTAAPATFVDAPETSQGRRGYRPTHLNHPCTIWARECRANYLWLLRLGHELVREFQFRFGKPHACHAHLVWLEAHVPVELPVTEGDRTTRFAVAMPDECQTASSPVACYREFYRTSKEERGLIEYTRRSTPHWMYDAYRF